MIVLLSAAFCGNKIGDTNCSRVGAACVDGRVDVFGEA